MHKAIVNSKVDLFSSCLYIPDSSMYCIYRTLTVYFHFKVTVLRTILGLDVTSSRNHHAVKYHKPAIAHLLCPAWKGGRGWTRKLMRWVMSFLTTQSKEKWDLVSHSHAQFAPHYNLFLLIWTKVNWPNTVCFPQTESDSYNEAVLIEIINVEEQKGPQMLWYFLCWYLLIRFIQWAFIHKRVKAVSLNQLD